MVSMAARARALGRGQRLQPRRKQSVLGTLLTDADCGSCQTHSHLYTWPFFLLLTLNREDKTFVCCLKYPRRSLLFSGHRVPPDRRHHPRLHHPVTFLHICLGVCFWRHRFLPFCRGKEAATSCSPVPKNQFRKSSVPAVH